MISFAPNFLSFSLSGPFFLTKQHNLCFVCDSRSIKWLPMNPVAPVMKIFICFSPSLKNISNAGLGYFLHSKLEKNHFIIKQLQNKIPPPGGECRGRAGDSQRDPEDGINH
jgi:hypothetical protein